MYDQLLGARGTAPHAEALQAPVLRLRLLRSLLYLVHAEAVRNASRSAFSTSVSATSCPLAQLCFMRPRELAAGSTVYAAKTHFGTSLWCRPLSPETRRVL